MTSTVKSRKETSLCVVDDEDEIREMIVDHLTDEGYRVFAADNAKTALEEILCKHPVDLILSDINMPVMKGFELLNKVREAYPATKRVLITAYNVEDYFDLALKYNIGNIFVKTTPFNFQELAAILENLLSGDIFGVWKYFAPNNTTLKSYFIKQGKQLEADAQRIVSNLPIIDTTNKIELVLIELLANAVFYGIRKESAEKKEEWCYNFELSDSEAIAVASMYDSEKFAVSITDNGGRLKKSDVLYWLHRQLAIDEKGLPLGIFDSHGRGFFIARQYIDRLIINIDKNKRTEIVLINYFTEVFQGFKPIYINEI
jgi:CheY-like chemotaxis protein/anti-sigma regulatory factor (Ser/Thr protein kinase)